MTMGTTHISCTWRGFREARLSIDQVKAKARYIEELLETARNTVAGAGKVERKRCA